MDARTQLKTQALLLMLCHVMMTSCDKCASCVYGECNDLAADDIITCSCITGYTGQYCHLVDTNRITIKTTLNAAILHFEPRVRLEDIRLTVTPNKSRILVNRYPDSIGIKNLDSSTKYDVCMVAMFNSSALAADDGDVMTILDKTVELPDIQQEAACIAVTTSRDYEEVYTLIAQVCAAFVGGTVLILIVYQLLKMSCQNRELQFYNIAQADETLLEDTIYNIFEKRLDIAEARPILLYKVFRKPLSNKKGSCSEVDLKTQPVIVYFSKTRERRFVLRHARVSNKVSVDGIRILLPPGSGF